MDKSVWKESGALDVDFKDKGGAGGVVGIHWILSNPDFGHSLPGSAQCSAKQALHIWAFLCPLSSSQNTCTLLGNHSVFLFWIL